jgi:hypothetical protein
MGNRRTVYVSTKVGYSPEVCLPLGLSVTYKTDSVPYSCSTPLVERRDFAVVLSFINYLSPSALSFLTFTD